MLQQFLYPCILAPYITNADITTSNRNNQLWPTWHSIQILNQSSQSPPWFRFALQPVVNALAAPKGLAASSPYQVQAILKLGNW